MANEGEGHSNGSDATSYLVQLADLWITYKYATCHINLKRKQAIEKLNINPSPDDGLGWLKFDPKHNYAL